MAIPAGFGLITLAFIAQAAALLTTDIPANVLFLNFIYLLTQTYGLLFIAFTYARRTRLRWVGESTPIELAIGIAITAILLGSVFASSALLSPVTMLVEVELFLRTVMVLSMVYLIYETVRNWRFLRKAAEGFVAIAFALLLVEQIGFILAAADLGIVATFLGYEGRLLGLFELIALVYIGVKKDDFMTVLKRLGLGAPAH